MVGRTTREDGRWHACDWWFIENQTLKKEYNPALDKLKGHGKAARTLKQLNLLATTSGASRLIQIHDAAKMILANVHFKGEWSSRIWNILQYIPFTSYWKIRRVYNQIMGKIDLSELVLFNALPEQYKQGMPKDPSMTQIHQFFSNSENQKKLEEVKTIALHLSMDTKLSLHYITLFPNLESLVITGGTVTLPKEIVKLKHLSSLAINHCSLKDLPKTLKDIKSLRYLSFGHTDVSEQNFSLISTLSNITHLDLTESFFPKFYPKRKYVFSPQITHLLLRGNRWKEWPKNITLPTHLEVLDISNNDLSELPASLEKLGELRSLRCKNTKTLVLPDTLAKCSKLESIEVYPLTMSTNSSGFNSTTEFKNSIKSYKLSEEKLPSFHEWPHLKRLVIPHIVPDQAEKLSEELEKTQGNEIEHINLDLSKLKAFPQNITNWKQLKSVTLHLGKGQTIPKEVLQLPSLQFLKISGGSLENLDLSACKQLKHLALHFSEMKEYPKGIEMLSNLETLILHRSKQFFDIQPLQNLQKYEISFHETIDLSQSSFASSNIIDLEIGGAFVSLPKEIEKLQNLQRLKIWNRPKPNIRKKEEEFLFEYERGMTSLPKEIALLKNLRDLWVCARDVKDGKEFSQGILQLPNLQKIDADLHEDALSKSALEFISSMSRKQYDLKEERKRQTYFSKLSF